MNESPALKRAREQLVKDKESVAQDPSPETPVNPGQASDSDLTPADDLQKQIADKEAKIEELTKKLNAADGRRGSELETLRNQVSHLTEQMAAAAAEKEALRSEQELKAKANAPLSPDVFAGIDKELLEDYDESALRVMATVAENISRQQLANLPQVSPDEIRELRETTEYKNYLASVETLAPGFISVNGDAEAGIDPKPEWLEFLGQPVNSDLSDETWGQMAGRIGTPAFAAKTFQAFQAQSGSEQGIEKPSLAGQVAPSKSSASPSGKASSKSQLTRSDYEKLQRRAATPGGLTQEIRDELNKYRQAEIEGKLV